ncbi:MAG: glycosyltransferase [Alphaproteobacteria bacterium]|nr:glycosyltransferase [Alphaproteobacteria bacterium]
MIEKKPKISVIVPIYNVEKYIHKCLDSIINQTLSDIEIILVDDLGTDNSMKIAHEFATNDKRIKIISHDKNRGLSAARNTGIKNSNAPFIMFLDSDDFYKSTMCEKMLNAIEPSNADIAVCGVNVIYEADKNLAKSDKAYFNVKFNGLREISDNTLYGVGNDTAWNKIFRRDILDKHDIWFPEGLKFEDNYFSQIYACWARNAFFVPEKLYYYRRRAGSIMNQAFAGKPGSNTDWIKIGIAIYEYLKRNNLFELYRDYMGKIFFSYIQCAIRLESTEIGKSGIYDLALDFIRREQWKPDDFSRSLLNQFLMLENRTLFNPEKKLSHGLVKIKETVGKKKIYFVGIPIWKTRYGDKKTKHYLFGFIRIAHKRFKEKKCRFDPDFSTKNFHPFKVDDSKLLSVLQSMPNFAFIPNPGNMGDALLSAATFQFFNRNNLNWHMWHGKQEDVVVYGGGGIWNPEYKKTWDKEFIPVFKKAKRIVILPSSFNNVQSLIDILDERFIVFCREKRSYEYLLSKNTKAEIILDHDMAFRMTEEILHGEIEMGEKEKHALNNVRKGLAAITSKTAKLMRIDKESTGWKNETDMDLSNKFHVQWNSPQAFFEFGTKIMLAAVDNFDAVITDRLHIGIAAALMRKEVYMLDNSYGKLSGVYENTMKNYPRAHFCKDLPDISNINPQKTAMDNFDRILKKIK